MFITHSIPAGRARLAARVSGDGDPVVFLHAAVCDSRMWRAEIDRVGANSKAIAYDRRGFGETTAEPETYSALADLLTVLESLGNGRPAVLVACSQGGRIAIDAALRHPSLVRGLVLIAPNIAGAPEPVHPPTIAALLAEQREAEAIGDWDRLTAIKARLWLDGPLAAEGRVTGDGRQLLHEMAAIAMRSPPVGPDADLAATPGVAPAFHRLGEIGAPALVIWGDLDFPHIQDRCRNAAAILPNGSGHMLMGAAHLPSLEPHADIPGLVAGFIDGCRAGQ